MLIDHRAYDFRPGYLGDWLAVYEELALPVQQRHLGRLLGFFTVETGPVNQAVFLWAYDDLGDRARRRKAMAADPAWAEFGRRSRPLGALERQTNKLLRPVPFTPLALPAADEAPAPARTATLFDHRTYDLSLGQLPRWLSLYETAGWPVQERHLGRLLGLFTTDVGPLNQLVWIWGYADADDRTRRRSAMEADPAWAAFRRESDGMGAIERMENKLLEPVGFSPPLAMP